VCTLERGFQMTKQMKKMTLLWFFIISLCQAASSSDFPSRVDLQVGEIEYRNIPLEYLRNSSGMLGAMFKKDNFPMSKEVKGIYFIDGDGTLFKFIIKFLRNRRLILDDIKTTELCELYFESKRFCLEELVAILAKEIVDRSFREKKKVFAEIWRDVPDVELVVCKHEYSGYDKNKYSLYNKEKKRKICPNKNIAVLENIIRRGNLIFVIDDGKLSNIYRVYNAHTCVYIGVLQSNIPDSLSTWNKMIGTHICTKERSIKPENERYYITNIINGKNGEDVFQTENDCIEALYKLYGE
jgi:hypothetical protein